MCVCAPAIACTKDTRGPRGLRLCAWIITVCVSVRTRRCVCLRVYVCVRQYLLCRTSPSASVAAVVAFPVQRQSGSSDAETLAVVHLRPVLWRQLATMPRKERGGNTGNNNKHNINPQYSLLLSFAPPNQTLRPLCSIVWRWCNSSFILHVTDTLLYCTTKRERILNWIPGCNTFLMLAVEKVFPRWWHNTGNKKKRSLPLTGKWHLMI